MRRFIGSALFLLASAGWASAALGPLEAAVILIEAKATNAKCAFLSPAEAEKLNGFVARAEVSAGLGHDIDHLGAQFVGQLLQFRSIEPARVGGRGDLVEQRRAWRHVTRTNLLKSVSAL